MGCFVFNVVECGKGSGLILCLEVVVELIDVVKVGGLFVSVKICIGFIEMVEMEVWIMYLLE